MVTNEMLAQTTSWWLMRRNSIILNNRKESEMAESNETSNVGSGGGYPSGAPNPEGANLNDLIDFFVDNLQKSKNFVTDVVAQESVDVAQDVVSDINALLDELIDKAQELKG
jgi:hypothetical protein